MTIFVTGNSMLRMAYITIKEYECVVYFHRLTGEILTVEIDDYPGDVQKFVNTNSKDIIDEVNKCIYDI